MEHSTFEMTGRSKKMPNGDGGQSGMRNTDIFDNQLTQMGLDGSREGLESKGRGLQSALGH